MRRVLLVVAGIVALLASVAYARGWWPFTHASHAELPALTPSTARHAELLLPDLDGNGDPAVEVDVWVPRDYVVEPSEGNEIDLASQTNSRALRIAIRSSWTYAGRKPPILWTRTCGGIEHEGTTKTHVIRSEDRPDGWLALCRASYKLDDGREFSYTYVVRDVRWGGSDAQCVIQFHDDDDPSSARLSEAIAVCDSMKLREPTKRESDQEIWGPDGSGLRGVRPIKPMRRLRGSLALDGGIHATAEILAPIGYDVDSMKIRDVPMVLGWVRPNSPTIDLLAGWPQAPRFADRQCGGLEVVMEPKTRLVRSEDRSDGWLAVCELQEDGETITAVVRDMHWSGAEAQCVVRFRQPDRATPVRINDAVAICDSTHFEMSTPSQGSRSDDATKADHR